MNFPFFFTYAAKAPSKCDSSVVSSSGILRFQLAETFFKGLKEKVMRLFQNTLPPNRRDPRFHLDLKWYHQNCIPSLLNNAELNCLRNERDVHWELRFEGSFPAGSCKQTSTYKSSLSCYWTDNIHKPVCIRTYGLLMEWEIWQPYGRLLNFYA